MAPHRAGECPPPAILRPRRDPPGGGWKGPRSWCGRPPRPGDPPGGHPPSGAPPPLPCAAGEGWPPGAPAIQLEPGWEPSRWDRPPPHPGVERSRGRTPHSLALPLLSGPGRPPCGVPTEPPEPPDPGDGRGRKRRTSRGRPGSPARCRPGGATGGEWRWVMGRAWTIPGRGDACLRPSLLQMPTMLIDSVCYPRAGKSVNGCGAARRLPD